KIFVPFYTTKASSGKGTGLGLYVIKRIIEFHKGRISVASKYGQGTTFKLELPLAPAPSS
ncbi:MAG: HAMP domain-containing sensor histidine kinase, partial [Candidatus Omnitrophota bacterium]